MKPVPWVFLLGAALSATPVWAEDPDDDTGVLSLRKPKASSVIRQESLELPGLTACHQCEWRPKPHQKAAAEQCGTAADGTAKLGIFECGFSPDCDRVCNFVQCAN
jgi:hypothetical protein